MPTKILNVRAQGGYLIQVIINLLFILDVNECLIKKGGCDQICLNKPGSRECKCHNGYRLAPNKKTCIGNILRCV